MHCYSQLIRLLANVEVGGEQPCETAVILHGET